MEISTNIEVEIKSLSPEIAERLFELTEKNRNHIGKTLPWIDGVKTVNDTLDFINNFKKQESENEGIVFGIWYQNNLVGVIDFHKINNKEKNAQIGYWIDEDYQGKGIVTKACEMLVKHGFNVLNLNRLEIHCLTDNSKSANIAKRLGFVKEGILRESTIRHGRFQDMELYSLLKNEVKF
ncbi:MAG: GNAT family N-acetyltransferase [Candidatus Pacebacteria bacterium]|nr:GNAT family N-acetyltransferase [Candidatus Paceibacterota bacterium]MBP9716026.1 GNAT family N-acetyltransferase [Candidatus Paceibacterota bacterium]